ERTQEYLREAGRGQAFKCLQTALLPLAFCPLVISFLVGAQHWAVPSAVAAGAVAFTLLMPTTIRSGARRIRQEEQETSLASRWARARRVQARGRPAGETPPL